MPLAEYPSQCSVMGRSKTSHHSPPASGASRWPPSCRPVERTHALTLSILGSAVADDLIAANPAHVRGAGATKRAQQIEPGRRRDDQHAARRIMIFPAYLPLAAANTGREGDDRIREVKN
jgi:hypothetical protein